jgi:4,5-DOPA dioxygenase extradiol
MNLQNLHQFSESLSATDLMPTLFLGHGSPVNGIEVNAFTDQWSRLGRDIRQPKAVIVISAHWLTKGTKITAMAAPKTIHDFGGFSKELFAVQYPAPGDPALALETSRLISSTHVGLDHEWGLDHGTWTVVRHMYPNANIPVLQLSLDYDKPAAYHYNLARELSALRRKGVLIIGSGNMIHNLRMVAWDKAAETEYGYDWAMELKVKFKNLIEDGNHDSLIHYEKLGTAARYAIPTPDHYFPLMYTLGLQEKNEQAELFNDVAVMGSLTMSSVQIGLN